MSPVGGVSEIKALLGVGSTDSRAIHFGANESKEDRMRRIEEITKGNPNVKLSPEAFQKLMQGGEVDVTLNLDAPERRNLFIGAFATLAQMGGAAGGAAYNKDLGDAVTSRVSGDAQFVAKHGNNYKMNLFGGAEAQTGSIQVGDPVFDPTLSNDDITTDKIKENNAVAATNMTKTVNKPNDTPMALAIQARFLAKFGYKEQEMSGKGDSTQDRTKGNAITRSMFNGEYGKSAVDQGRKGVIASIHVYGKNGENYLNGDDLKGSFDKLGKDGKVIKTSPEGEARLIKQVTDTRKKAVQEYLQLGLSSGVINQDDLNGKDLIDQFKTLEGKLKATYGDESKTVLDGFLGDHHIMAMQRAISDKLQYNQGAAYAINMVFNNQSGASIGTFTPTTKKDGEANSAPAGMLTIDQKRAALEFMGGGKNLSNLSNDDVEKKFKEFENRVRDKDPSISGQAITALDGVTRAQKDLLFGKGGENNKITGGLFGTAHGIYATHNTFLAQNIMSTGLVDPSQFKGELKKALGSAKLVDNLVAGPNKGTSFDDQIQKLKDRLLSPAQATTQISDQVSLKIDGKETSLTDLVAAVNSGKVSFSDSNRTEALKVLQKAQEQVTSSTNPKAEGKTTDLEKAIEALSKESSVSGQNQVTIAKNIGNVNTFLDGNGNHTGSQLKKAEDAIKVIESQMGSASPENKTAFEALKARLGAIVPQTNAEAVVAAKAAQAPPSDPLLAQFSNVRKAGTEAGVDPKVKKMLSEGASTEAIATALKMDVKVVEAEKEKLDTSIKKMLGEGFSPDFISKVTGVSDKYVEKLKDESTPIGKKILEALPELSTKIAAGFFDLADQILNRLNKEAAGSFEYGFGHGNGGRITSKIGGAADQDKNAEGNINVSSQAFETGLKAGNGLKSGFDLIKQYGKNRELEANEDKISVREGVRRYNDKIEKYVAGSTPAEKSQIRGKYEMDFPLTDATKNEPAKYGQSTALKSPIEEQQAGATAVQATTNTPLTTPQQVGAIKAELDKVQKPSEVK